MKTKMKAASVATLLLLSIGLSACSEKIPPEEAVKQRVLARWDIRKAGKVEGLYDYLSPAIKQTVSRYNYEGRFGTNITYTHVKITDISCNKTDDKPADVCQVKVYVSTKTKDFISGSPLKETWILEGDQWWLVTM